MSFEGEGKALEVKGTTQSLSTLNQDGVRPLTSSLTGVAGTALFPVSRFWGEMTPPPPVTTWHSARPHLSDFRVLHTELGDRGMNYYPHFR